MFDFLNRLHGDHVVGLMGILGGVIVLVVLILFPFGCCQLLFEQRLIVWLFL